MKKLLILFFILGTFGCQTETDPAANTAQIEKLRVRNELSSEIKQSIEQSGSFTSVDVNLGDNQAVVLLEVEKDAPKPETLENIKNMIGRKTGLSSDEIRIMATRKQVQ